MVQITFHALYGAYDEGPMSFLLKIDDVFTFLLDCGWSDPYQLDMLEPVLDDNVLQNIDAGIVYMWSSLMFYVIVCLK